MLVWCVLTLVHGRACVCTISRWQAVQVIAPRAAAAKAAMATLSQSIERGRLRHVLAAVLTAGNLMNAGTAKGQADGFKATRAPCHAMLPCLFRTGTESSYSLSHISCVSPAVGTSHVLLYAAYSAALPSLQPLAILTAVGCVEYSFATRLSFAITSRHCSTHRATSGRAVGRGLCRSRSLRSSSQSKMRPARSAPLCAGVPPLGTVPAPWAPRRRIHRARPRYSRLAWR